MSKTIGKNKKKGQNGKTGELGSNPEDSPDKQKGKMF
jgi:hypothetical protein